MDSKVESLRDILKRDTVNSKLTNNSLDTVNSNATLVDKICNFIEQEQIEPAGIALLISELLSDKKSLNYYLLLAKEHNNGILLDLAYQTRERDRLGLIKTIKPIYFIGILRRIGFKSKFR